MVNNGLGCDPASPFERDPRILAEEIAGGKKRAEGEGENQSPGRRLKALTAGELLMMEIPEREMLLAPIIPAKGLVEFYSKRGVGKTFVALCIAYAVASGGAYLRWQAPAPRRVLVVDGEMPLVTLKERLASIALSSVTEPPSPEYIRIIAADHQEFGIPDLSTKEGVEALEEHIADGVDLVILDNLSTLCRGGKENESESWVPIQEWILSLRRRGISVVFVHHAGKGGAQRGTSKREDVLDTVVVLRHPDDYSPSEGARFEVHLDKARGVYGEQAQPFEAQLTTNNDVMTWTMRDLENVEVQRAADLKGEGFSVRDIATELGLSKSRVDRLLKKSDEAGARRQMNGNPRWVDT
jgi:putative DNA primase/helicase